ncbi:hypothetical protein PILCRDRAFT_104252 [Piloderma croceum F 1598]|uniref:DUF676 domain-containing protein n=1 Tax=Piloderma croceum (strain F 1598) TaxID=765440 RepID=A0A0C3GJU1_PILCF|nr:hypothetical protein PILCRDRAFT_104252 [Piloderma croceum F 1598]
MRAGSKLALSLSILHDGCHHISLDESYLGHSSRMAALPKAGVDNSNLKQEFPRTSENDLSSVQKLNDLDVDVDIIAVQGLASTYEWSWSIESEDGTRYHWLRELLPQNLQKPRVLAFEYNSEWYENPAHATLDDCGKRFLECLVEDRTHRGHTHICGGRRNRPILFVGHSFGGLVIKQALVIASQTHHEEPRYADYRDILYATAGVIFLATPHRGSSFSTLAKWKMQAGRLFGVQTYPELVSILDLGSPSLTALQQNFQKILSRSLLADLQLFCFYEELPLAMVVKRESACIGIGGVQSLEANHMEMNKFGPSGTNHKNYLLFEAELLEMYNRGKEIVRRRFAGMYSVLVTLLLCQLPTHYSYAIR